MRDSEASRYNVYVYIYIKYHILGAHTAHQNHTRAYFKAYRNFLGTINLYKAYVLTAYRP